MKTRNQFLLNAFRILSILVLLLGIYIAWTTYEYKVIVRGVEGGALIYLLSYYLRTSKTDLPFNIIISESKIYNHLIFTFIGPIIAFWAFAGVLDMVLFLVQQVFAFMR